MAAEITSNGIQFSDSTQVNTRGWMTPDNTAMFFFQSSAFSLEVEYFPQ